MNVEQIFKTRIERASRVLENPESGPKTICFKSSDLLRPEKLNELHAQFPKNKSKTIYLYQIHIKSRNKSLASQARTAFRTLRAKRIYNMSRDNKNHPDSNCLYVGISENLHSRFRTHLGRGDDKTTWALYLSKWAPQFNIQLTANYYEFKETVAEDVELIEGILWDSLRPLFGKKGGK